jgi:ribosomal protein S18 acetylase RimI-like enzyme
MLEWRGATPALRAALVQEFALLEDGKRLIFVAFEAAQMVGTVQLVREHADSDLSKDAVYLQALEVHAAHRRQGIARLLIETLENQSRLEGARRVTLMVEPANTPALALYQRLGFTVFKTSTDTWDDKQYPVLCLEKPLT